MLVQLTLLLPAIGAFLRLLGFKRARDLLASSARTSAVPRSDDIAQTHETARRVARLVSIAARHGPYRATCLRRALALWWLLRRRGLAAELRIGVRKDNSELRAHAWVEYEGEPLGDDGDSVASYAAFGPAFPSKVHSGP